MGVAYSQVFPPAPTLTESNLASQKGKVFIVTGGSSGIGLQLATILYRSGGKVYIAARSETKTRDCIEQIKTDAKDVSSVGHLEYLPLVLDDLTTIKASAEEFMSKEAKLDVLWNNAGISAPPLGSQSKQGHDLQLATNCLGPYLFTQLLLPSLKAAARDTPAGSVRVIWTASQMMELRPPKGGMDISRLDGAGKDPGLMYTISKTGNWFLASELAHDVGSLGILSVAQNPGALATDIFRHNSWMSFAASGLLHNPKFGAYTGLWCGLSPELEMEDNGSYILPWGRRHPGPLQELLKELKSTEEGGTGKARQFAEWCKKKTDEFR